MRHPTERPVVVQRATGKLFGVASTGVRKEIGLGGATLPNGDGLLLHGRTLTPYSVVQVPR